MTEDNMTTDPIAERQEVAGQDNYTLLALLALARGELHRAKNLVRENMGNSATLTIDALKAIGLADYALRSMSDIIPHRRNA